MKLKDVKPLPHDIVIKFLKTAPADEIYTWTELRSKLSLPTNTTNSASFVAGKVADDNKTKLGKMYVFGAAKAIQAFKKMHEV